MSAELVELVRKDLAELGVEDPTCFVPDGDEIAAAVVDLFFVREDIMPPLGYNEAEAWLVLNKRVNADEAGIRRFQELYGQLYLNEGFRSQVLKVLFERSHENMKQADKAWWEVVENSLDKDFEKVDLMQIFGPRESDKTQLNPGTGMADLGAARKFIEQKYPLVTPGVLITFLFSAGAIIDAGRGAELDELMCERLLAASSPKILGRNAVIFADRHQVMGNIGGRLAQKYLELSHEEISLIQTTPLKPEHQEILASMRS